MLQSIKELYGEKLGASDGEMGHVKDFYFDDTDWVVRYVVADTGSWLPKRQVLLSPHAFGSLVKTGKIIHVNLSRKQIEDSPSIASHKPISRRDEEEYFNYYGWPSYWAGEGLWGSSGFPMPIIPDTPVPVKKPLAKKTAEEEADAHLRSTRAVHGYEAQAGGETVGHIADFLMDPQSWAIRELVIKSGHAFTAKEWPIPVDDVERISYDAAAVFVKLTQRTA